MWIWNRPLQRVREQVEFAKAELPLDIDDEPRVQDIDFSQIPVLVVSLAGEVGLVQLKEIAELLKDDIEAISGVNRVTVVGGREREVEGGERGKPDQSLGRRMNLWRH